MKNSYRSMGLGAQMFNFGYVSRCDNIRVVIWYDRMVRPIHRMLSGPNHCVALPEAPIGPKNRPLCGRLHILAQRILRDMRCQKARASRLTTRVRIQPSPFLAGRFPFLGLVHFIYSGASYKKKQERIDK